MDRSFWFSEVPDERRFPALDKNIKVDVCILGGGIAGVSAAYFLAKSGLKVALLESNHIGTGATGYTTAFATHFLDSTEATVKAWQTSEESVRLLKETITAERINCDWQDVEGIYFSQKEEILEFKKDFEVYKKADPTLEYYEDAAAKKLLGFDARAAIRKKTGEGQFHIRKFLLGLTESAKKYGAQIFEESRMTKLTLGETISVATERGRIESKKLVVATGLPSQEYFPEITKKLKPYATYVIQVKFPGNKPFGKALFWDDLKPYHYLRWVSDQDLILGGEDRPIPTTQNLGDPHQNLEEWLRKISGEFSVVNKWAGGLFYTPDVLPFVGPHSSYDKNAIFLTGWGGNGMTFGFLSGKIACDITRTEESPFQSLFAPNRF